jgi:hypothetical protein
MKKITNEDNKKLFLYGLISKLKVLGGWGIIFVGIGLGVALESIIPFLIGAGLGGYVIYLGKAERFDYKLRSGYLVHKGDV